MALGGELLGKHHLKDISGPDILLNPFYRSEKCLSAEAGTEYQGLRGGRRFRGRGFPGACEECLQFIEPYRRFQATLGGILQAVPYQCQPAGLAVQHHQAPSQMELVGGKPGQCLQPKGIQPLHGLVGHMTDNAGGRRGGVRKAAAADPLQRPVGFLQAEGPGQLLQCHGLQPDAGITAGVLSLAEALQQEEGGLVRLQLLKKGRRRQQVGLEPPGNGVNLKMLHGHLQKNSPLP